MRNYHALGQPGMSVVLTVISLGTRVATAYLLSAVPAFGVSGIWWSVPIGWALADTVGLLSYQFQKKSLLSFGTAGSDCPERLRFTIIPQTNKPPALCAGGLFVFCCHFPRAALFCRNGDPFPACDVVLRNGNQGFANARNFCRKGEGQNQLCDTENKKCFSQCGKTVIPILG